MNTTVLITINIIGLENIIIGVLVVYWLKRWTAES